MTESARLDGEITLSPLALMRVFAGRCLEEGLLAAPNQTKENDSRTEPPMVDNASHHYHRLELKLSPLISIVGGPLITLCRELKMAELSAANLPEAPLNPSRGCSDRTTAASLEGPRLSLSVQSTTGHTYFGGNRP